MLNEKIRKEKMKYSSIADTLVKDKPKKVLVLKGNDMSTFLDAAVILETLVGVCKDEDIEIETISDYEILKYMGVDLEDSEDKWNYNKSNIHSDYLILKERREITEKLDKVVKKFEKEINLPVKEEITSLMAKRLESKVDGADKIIYLAGCPCCIGKEFTEIYYRLRENFGPEKVYLVSKEESFDSTNCNPYIMKVVPAPINVLVIGHNDLKPEVKTDVAVRDLTDTLDLSVEDVYSLIEKKREIKE